MWLAYFLSGIVEQKILTLMITNLLNPSFMAITFYDLRDLCLLPNYKDMLLFSSKIFVSLGFTFRFVIQLKLCMYVI